jgi:hypothetical protein
LYQFPGLQSLTQAGSAGKHLPEESPNYVTFVLFASLFWQ